MPLANDAVIWITKSTGVTIENYNDKYAIKSVRKYLKGQDEVLTYDWIYIEEYDKEKKKRVMSDKPRPASIYLGDKDQAIKALGAMLRSLGGTPELEGQDVPF